MDAYVAEDFANPSHTTIIFTLKEEAGALAETLRIFKELLTLAIINFCQKRKLKNIWINF